MIEQGKDFFRIKDFYEMINTEIVSKNNFENGLLLRRRERKYERR
jgi:hypothetical protein